MPYSQGGPRAALGLSEGGVLLSQSTDNDGHQEVTVRGPTTGQGGVVVVAPEPAVQIDASFGLRTDTDVEVFVDTSPGTGSATAAAGLYDCATGAGVGGYGVVRSRRVCRVRPAQSARFVFDARFDTGLTNCLLVAGAFTSVDALWFGFWGTQFGVFKRIPGALEVQRLTVSAGATGTESLTVTLDGTDYTFNVAGSTDTAAQTAARIAAGSAFGSAWAVQSVDDTVVFHRLAATPNADGTFALTNNTGGGTAAGTFSQRQVGAANNPSSPAQDPEAAGAFVPQTSWNVDVCDGSGSASNPSGLNLDPTKLNTFEIVISSQTGTIDYRVWLASSGYFVTVHRIAWANAQTGVAQRWPVYHVGWTAASLGSTTDLHVYGSHGAGFVEGLRRPLRAPESVDATTPSTITTTEVHVLTVRAPLVYADQVNQGEAFLIRLDASVDQTSNRAGRLRAYKNATITGNVEWVATDSGELHTASGASVTGFSGGRKVASFPFSTNDSARENVVDLEIRLLPGESLTLTAQLVSSTATVTVGAALSVES